MTTHDERIARHNARVMHALSFDTLRNAAKRAAQRERETLPTTCHNLCVFTRTRGDDALTFDERVARMRDTRDCRTCEHVHTCDDARVNALPCMSCDNAAHTTGELPMTQ